MNPLDPRTTAVLLMDFQQGIVGRVGDQAEGLLARTAGVLARAREVGALVAFVRVAFRPGYPEVNPANEGFATVKKAGLMLLDAPETQIVDALAPRAEEPVVVKHRVSAFGPTALEPILRAHRTETLVLLGIATSGVVLSTVRHAADADYRVVVAEDGCADADAEVHRVLMQKVFPRQATVTSCEAIRAALG